MQAFTKLDAKIAPLPLANIDLCGPPTPASGLRDSDSGQRGKRVGPAACATRAG